MRMNTMRVSLIGSAVLLMGVLGAAQTHDHAAPVPPTTAAQQAAPRMDRQKMMAEMQASQARLDDLVAQMNAATGPEKVDRIAAVVNEMAAMHKRMNAMVMQGGMMQMMRPSATP